MTEVISVLAAAALFAVFGLLRGTRITCAGPDACAAEEGRKTCGGCWFGRSARESRDA